MKTQATEWNEMFTIHVSDNLNPNYIFKNLLHHLLVHNKLPPINQFKACIYALTLSVGQKFRRSLAGVKCLQVFYETSVKTSARAEVSSEGLLGKEHVN